MKYIYFVSCATSTGFCSMEVMLNKKITTIADIINASEIAKKEFGNIDIMVLNYQLLRTTKK